MSVGANPDALIPEDTFGTDTTTDSVKSNVNNANFLPTIHKAIDFYPPRRWFVTNYVNSCDLWRCDYGETSHRHSQPVLLNKSLHSLCQVSLFLSFQLSTFMEFLIKCFEHLFNSCQNESIASVAHKYQVVSPCNLNGLPFLFWISFCTDFNILSSPPQRAANKTPTAAAPTISVHI